MNIAIIGAGATGLTAAHKLVKAGHQVTIYEASSTPGGLAGGFKLPEWNWSLEYYYHHWFTSDQFIKSLVHELGLAHKLIFSSPKSVVAFSNHFYPLDSPMAILNFPGMSFPEKIRFSAVTGYLKYIASWQSLEKVTAHSWLKRYYGTHAYELIWQPLLKGKFDLYYKDANMAWMWARIKARTPKLGTYQGGFQAFFDDFTSILKTKGVTILYSTKVKKIHPVHQKIQIVTENNKKQFDKCLVTTSPQLFAKFTPDLPSSYHQQLHRLKSIGAVVAILSLKHPLSRKGYYWYSLPKGSSFPYLALVEHTNFVDSQHFAGEHLIYCGDYCPPDHPYFTYTDKKLIKTFLPTLKHINPQFQPNWIKRSFVFKAPYAQPVPTCNHSQNIPSIVTPIPNLFLASMSQVYPWDRGTNFAVKLGTDAVDIMTKVS